MGRRIAIESEKGERVQQDSAELEKSYERGLFLDVYRELESRFGPRGPDTAEDLALAARTSDRLQLTTLAQSLRRRLGRQFPAAPASRLQWIYYLFERGRWLEALELALDDEAAKAWGQQDVARWLGARVTVQAALRDFEAAAATLNEATALAPDDPWFELQRAWICFLSDRVDEATARARELCARNADDVLAHEFLSACLHERNQREDALAAYRDAASRFQAPRVEFGLAQVLLELDQPREARLVLERLLETYPWPRRGFRLGILAALSMARYLTDDREGAVAAARQIGESHAWLVERLSHEAPEHPCRRKLEVPYVRQEHLGCVPASLASMLRYFGETIDPTSVADEITYDGTPSHRRRRWCLDAGYTTREFQFDPRAARGLLDSGVPFLLTTYGPFGGHQQVVVGYDGGLRTWLLREPGFHQIIEIDESALLRDVAAHGAACAVVCPERLAHGLPPRLPRERETETLVELEQAVFEHRAEDAQAAFEVIATLAPGPLRWDSERLMAWFRDDAEGALAASRAQHEATPEDPLCQELVASSLNRSGRLKELRDFLEKQHERADCAPNLTVMLVDLLSDRATDHSRARVLARRVSRRLPGEARAVHAFATLCWKDVARREEALRFYRIAACLALHDEQLALSYFEVADRLGRAEEALSFLENRVRDLGAKSSEPAVTLAEAMHTLHRSDQALDTLKTALAKHENPATRRKLLEQLARMGRHDEARELLAAGEGKLRPLDMQLARAMLCRAAGDHPGALEALEAAARERPEHPTVQAQRLQLLIETGRADAATEEAVALVRRYPHHSGLARVVHQLLWMAGDLAAAEELLRIRLASDPAETFAACALGELLLRRGRHAEALERCEANSRDHPHLVDVWIDLGAARAANGDARGARDANRRALELDVDCPRAMTALVQLAGGQRQAGADLEFVFEELCRQGPGSAGLKSFVALARQHVDEARCLELLHRLEREFPADPHPGEAQAELLLEQGRLSEAAHVAECLQEVFPWRVEPALLRARSLLLAGAHDTARSELRRTVARDPGCGEAWRILAHSFQLEGDLGRASQVLEEARQAAAGDPSLLGFLAELEWHRGRSAEALSLIRQANELAPGYEAGMRTEIEWMIDSGRLQDAYRLARTFVEGGALFVGAHLSLAQACMALGRFEEWMAAMRRALELDPRLGDTREQLVRQLVGWGRLSEARQVAAEGLAVLGPDPVLLVLMAEVTRAEGRQSEALDELRRVLNEHPGAQGGWVLLLEWLADAGATDEILALYREPPDALGRNAVLRGFAAQVLLETEHLAEAEAALAQALELEPHYEWARMNLAQLYRFQGRIDDERALFEGWDDPNLYSPPGAALLGRAKAAGGDRAAVTACLERILRERDIDVWAVSELLAHVPRAPGGLGPVARSEDTFVRDGFLLVLALRQESWPADRLPSSMIRRLDEIRRHENAGARLARVLAALRDAGFAELLVPWVQRALPPPIEHVDLWGVCGSILSFRHPAQVVKIMAGHVQREGAKAWMLALLAVALREVGRLAEAGAVCHYGLSLPRDDSWWTLRSVLAHENYVGGDLDACSDLAEVAADAPPREAFEGRALLLLVALHRTRGYRARRRVLVQRVPELLVTMEHYEGTSRHALRDRFFRFFRRELLRLVPSWTAFRLRFPSQRELLRRALRSRRSRS